MNYDDYKTGLHDSTSPMNQKELDIEQVTIDADYYNELKDCEQKLKDLKYRIKLLIEVSEHTENTYMTNNLKKLLK